MNLPHMAFLLRCWTQAIQTPDEAPLWHFWILHPSVKKNMEMENVFKIYRFHLLLVF